MTVRGRGGELPRARGVVLFTTLVLLALLTMVGISGALVVRMEQGMARNAHDSMLAFQAAESALRDAEDWLAANATDPAAVFPAPGQGRHGAPAWGTAPGWRQDDVWQRGSAEATALGGVAMPPRYVIEWLTSYPDAAPPDGSGGTVDAFRITALGYGGTERAQVVLQTTFGRLRGVVGGSPGRLSWMEFDSVP
ncbi:MAG: hypothetical protein F4Y86_19580 [Gammaproteobacteria bacterium]|nr:hypothetical protein [Gammaproteobacteria bacterium]MYB36074.1 hypothetical protein [Gammaproteobacteria bacterium]